MDKNERRYKYDPVEDTEEYQAIAKELHETIMEEFRRSGTHYGLGMCHLYWAKKARILWQKYHIKWQSPAKLNPRRRFD